MGAIQNKESFVSINMSLEDILLKSDERTIRYLLAALALHFLQKATPQLARQVRDTTIHDWWLENGGITVCLGKPGDDDVIREDIHYFKENKVERLPG